MILAGLSTSFMGAFSEPAIVGASTSRAYFRLFIMLALVFALMTPLRPAIFLRPANFNSMMRQFPEYGIMSIGIALTMMTGGIDLAVVGTVNLSAVSGLIMMARANSAKADYRASYTLQCVLIAVLGGFDPNGGFGRIGGVTLAILILQILSTGLNMFENISNFYLDIIWGGVLIIVLLANWAVAKRAVRGA